MALALYRHYITTDSPATHKFEPMWLGTPYLDLPTAEECCKQISILYPSNPDVMVLNDATREIVFCYENGTRKW
jgi:hypothetical protein